MKLAIAASVVPPGLVTRRPTVAAITRRGNRVLAGLKTATADAGGPVKLRAVTNTQHEI